MEDMVMVTVAGETYAVLPATAALIEKIITEDEASLVLDETTPDSEF